MTTSLTGLRLTRRLAAVLIVGTSVLVGALVVRWAPSGDAARTVPDGSVTFAGSFPRTPTGPATLFRVDGTPVAVTSEALIAHFRFPAGSVYREASGDGSVVYRSWAAGEAPLPPSSRFTVTSASGGPAALLQFHHEGSGPRPSLAVRTAAAPVRSRAEDAVREALSALGLGGSRWSVIARNAYGPSGELGVLVEQVVETAHGPLPVGAAASGWALTDRDGHLVALSVAPAKFTRAGRVDLLSAEAAWERYSQHRADQTPTGASTVYTDVELAMAVFVDSRGAGVESLARPAWVFSTADGAPSLMLSADASAPGRVGETVVPAAPR